MYRYVVRVLGGGCDPGGVFFSSRRRHTRLTCDWSSDVCSSDLELLRRGLHEVLALDEGLPPELHAPRARGRIVGVIDSLEQIGRASCRERGQNPEGVGVFKKKSGTADGDRRSARTRGGKREQTQ